VTATVAISITIAISITKRRQQAFTVINLLVVLISVKAYRLKDLRGKALRIISRTLFHISEHRLVPNFYVSLIVFTQIRLHIFVHKFKSQKVSGHAWINILKAPIISYFLVQYRFCLSGRGVHCRTLRHTHTGAKNIGRHISLVLLNSYSTLLICDN
jgi:hypothetical protein